MRNWVTPKIYLVHKYARCVHKSVLQRVTDFALGKCRKFIIFVQLNFTAFMGKYMLIVLTRYKI